MILRRAIPGNAPALGAILSDWIDETPWMPRLHNRHEDQGFVAGLIAESEVWTDEAGTGFIARTGNEIPALYVTPAAQGRGLGAALLEVARSGCDSLSLWTFQANARAIAFYEREGFIEAARTDGENDEGLPDIRLIWRRSP